MESTPYLEPLSVVRMLYVSKELGLRIARALQEQAEELGMDVLLGGRHWTIIRRRVSGQWDTAREVRNARERV